MEKIKCKICDSEFEFNDGEKQFYIDRQLFYPPKRCPPCRVKRKKVETKE
jgi:rubredoxin